MKQITDKQIETIMKQVKNYAKLIIEYGKDYEESGLKFYRLMEDKYRNKLGALCRALETLGLVNDEVTAYYQFLDEAERELQDERQQ